MPQGNLDKHYGQGVLFVTYSLLISGSAKGSGGTEHVEGWPQDIMLRKGTRLHQIVQWLRGGDGDPLIVFDEAHKAKNLINTKGEDNLYLFAARGISGSSMPWRHLLWEAVEAEGVLSGMLLSLLPAFCHADRCLVELLPRPLRYATFHAGDSTQTGKTVEQLQLVLPRAKVIYSSATGASEPTNLVSSKPLVHTMYLHINMHCSACRLRSLT